MFPSDFSLGHLASPEHLSHPISIQGKDFSFLKNSLYDMLKIRLVEKHIAESKKNNLIRGPVHLGVGQEAIAVGVSHHLRSTDFVFGAHRSHSHLLALNSNIFNFFAELLGRSSGLSKGMGGSMHLIDKSVGFCGSVPIVSGTVPLAVGAAMASRLSGNDNVSVAYFGDGACEEGVVHESLNLASLNREPIVFVVENNLFASHMHISQRQQSNSTARFALPNNVNSKVVDGNDVVAVSNAACELIANARNGLGPGFLEAVTYRWYGHVDWREDIDVGVNRSKEDVLAWKKADPIERLFSSMSAKSLISNEEYASLQNSLNALIDEQWNLALSEPYPSDSSIKDYLYS